MLGDPEGESIFNGNACLDRLIEFERAMTLALERADAIPSESARAILGAIDSYSPDHADLRERGMVDGVVVPELVRQLRDHIGETHGGFLHRGATSQDAVDTALVLALRDHAGLLGERLDALIGTIEELESKHGDTPLMGYTRMQAALPITASHRLSAWRRPLDRLNSRLANLVDTVCVPQLGGPVGTGFPPEGMPGDVAKYLAAELGLRECPHAWHTDRTGLLEYGSFCSATTASCAKIGTDIALMARDGVITLSRSGSSSAMPHKSNPVDAEVLITLGAYTDGLLPTLFRSATCEMERSGSMWILEWMVLPQICIFSAKALEVAARALDSITGLHGIDESG